MENNVKDEHDTLHFVQQYESYIDATDSARTLAERDRDYRNLKQWTAEEKRKLDGRPAITIDYISRKADYFVGVEQEQRTDPKALPRTQEYERGAEAITDVLRYVEEQQRIDELATDCFENLIVEGVCAAIIDVDNKAELKVTQIEWDRYYYDPHSTKRDLSDKTFDGVVVWMDASKAKRIYKGKDEEIDNALGDTNVISSTHEDKPLWVDQKRKRIRICQHFYLNDDGQWWTCHFTKGAFLIDPMPSPYVDDAGEPVNPIVANSAFIDRENNRYGLLRQFVDIQDEINHRRSKALFLLSARQTFSTARAQVDEYDVRNQLARPDGHVKIHAGEFGVDFGTLPTNDMAQGQLAMFENAKAEILNYATSLDPDNASGRAMLVADNKAQKEVGRIFSSHRRFKTDIYRQCWMRIKQFWDQEKWVRITDDEQSLEWVGLNVPVTAAEKFISEQTGVEVDEIKQNHKDELEQIYQEMPQMRQIVEVKNDVAQMDVDISIEAVPDTLTLQQEQFQILADLAKVYGPQAVPFDSLVEVSGLRNKQAFLDKRKQADEAAGNAQAQAQQAQLMKLMSDIKNKDADTQVKLAQAMKTTADAHTSQLEGVLLTARPDITPNVII